MISSHEELGSELHEYCGTRVSLRAHQQPGRQALHARLGLIQASGSATKSPLGPDLSGGHSSHLEETRTDLTGELCSLHKLTPVKPLPPCRACAQHDASLLLLRDKPPLTSGQQSSKGRGQAQSVRESCPHTACLRAIWETC